MADLTSSEVLTDHQQELYLRLQSYCFDAPGGAVAFAAKLACEQGWSVAKSERVLGEYRRFVFLALEAGHAVSPSRPVDLAWHQHLLDTRSYWQEFCPGVLGRPLHHTPSRGGEEERQRLGECYRRTLRSYRAFFGEAPPADLWPAAVPSGTEAPAAEAPGAEAPAAATRPPRRVQHRWGMLLASLLVALVLGGCKAGYQNFPFSLNGPAFLLFYGVVTFVGCLEVKRQHQRWGLKARPWGVIVMGGVWLLGVARLLHGLSLGRPVGWLILVLIFVTLTLIATMFTSLWLDPKDRPDPRGGQTDGGGGASSGGCGGGGCGGGCGGGGGGGCGG
jgi:hypothetical protein